MSVQVDNNTATAIPDNDPAGIELTYEVSGAADCSGVRFSAYLTHDAPGDLLLDLQHPDGTTIRLFNHVSSGGADIGTSSSQGDRATFTDAPSRGSVNSGASPFVKTWGPSYPEMRRSFRRKPADGTWTLTIVDTGSGTTGTHENSSLFID